MDFGWDSAKAAANVRKHGVSFEEAVSSLKDDFAATASDLAHSVLAACRTCVTNASESLRCFTKDGSRSPEVGLQELTSNHPVLLRTKGAVVSDCGKGIVKDVR